MHRIFVSKARCVLAAVWIAISAGVLAFATLLPVEGPWPVWVYVAMLVGMPLLAGVFAASWAILSEHEQEKRKHQEIHRH